MWVQLFVLCITESSPLLHQVSLTNSELTEIFDNAPLEIPHHLWKHSDNGEQNGTNLPQASSSKQSSRAGTTAYDPNATLTEAEELALFAAHPDNGKEQKWWVSIHKDETPLAKCASCKVPIIKDKCYIYVHALYRPRHCLFVKDRSFYFCALKGCIEKHQNFSNLISPPDEIEVDPCCSMTPELYSELERRKLPIV